MKLYTDLMIDLETLDTAPSAAIRQIGLVAFDRDDPSESVDAFVKMQLVVDPDSINDRTISWDTIKFWLGQSDEARRAMIGEVGDGYIDSLINVQDFVASNLAEDGLVWGYSSTFDVVIMEDVFRQLDWECPWKYRQHACLRTLGRFPIFNELRAEPLIPHVAVEDALAQAKWCKRIYAALREVAAGHAI